MDETGCRRPGAWPQTPPAERSPLFDQAKDLLGEAGWGLGELYEAAREGPAQDPPRRALGLQMT
jgi:hypothetical protein